MRGSYVLRWNVKLSHVCLQVFEASIVIGGTRENRPADWCQNYLYWLAFQIIFELSFECMNSFYKLLDRMKMFSAILWTLQSHEHIGESSCCVDIANYYSKQWIVHLTALLSVSMRCFFHVSRHTINWNTRRVFLYELLVRFPRRLEWKENWIFFRVFRLFPTKATFSDCVYKFFE